MLFAAAHPVSAGTILELKIHLESDPKSIECLARVSRVEEDDMANMFKVAVYYLDIISADRVKINEFVRVKTEEKKGLGIS